MGDPQRFALENSPQIAKIIATHQNFRRYCGKVLLYPICLSGFFWTKVHHLWPFSTPWSGLTILEPITTWPELFKAQYGWVGCQQQSNSMCAQSLHAAYWRWLRSPMLMQCPQTLLCSDLFLIGLFNCKQLQAGTNGQQKARRLTYFVEMVTYWGRLVTF